MDRVDQRFLQLEKYLNEVYPNSHSDDDIVNRAIEVMQSMNEEWHRQYNRINALEERINALEFPLIDEF